jgi:hypothetical protein
MTTERERNGPRNGMASTHPPLDLFGWIFLVGYWVFNSLTTYRATALLVISPTPLPCVPTAL